MHIICKSRACKERARRRYLRHRGAEGSEMTGTTPGTMPNEAVVRGSFLLVECAAPVAATVGTPLSGADAGGRRRARITSLRGVLIPPPPLIDATPCHRKSPRDCQSCRSPRSALCRAATAQALPPRNCMRSREDSAAANHSSSLSF